MALGVDDEFAQAKYHPPDVELDCENLEKSKPGGFHPVNLGDTFDDRYRVVHKLGSGGFSTVWLARDVLLARWVALKIIVARYSEEFDRRFTIVNHPVIADSPVFAKPDRQFWLKGPNSVHLCGAASLGP